MSDHATPLIAGNLLLLEQGADLLGRLDDATYSTPPPVPMGSLGGHFRHCLDFYQRFLAGCESGVVDYDARERDARVESDRGYARDRLLAVIDEMRQLPPDCAELPLRVALDKPLDGADAPLGRSSVRRELQFLSSHTTHHYALIAAQLRLAGFDPGGDFGVAPSTLEYRRQQRLAGKT